MEPEILYLLMAYLLTKNLEGLSRFWQVPTLTTDLSSNEVPR